MEMSLEKRSLRIALIYAFIHVILYLVQRLCLIPIGRIENVNVGTVSILLSTIPLYLIGLPTALYLFKKIPSYSCPKEKKTLGPLCFLNCFFICYALLFTGGIISTSLEGLLSSFLGKPVLDPVALLVMSDTPRPLLIFATVVVAPAGEELLFRFLPYKKLCGFGTLPYMLITSFYFSLFHMNFFQGIYTFFAALVFSYVYAKTGKLRYCIMLHMMINFIGSVLAPLFSKNDASAVFFTLWLMLIFAIGLVKLGCLIYKKSFSDISFELSFFKPGWLINPGSIVFILLFLVASLKGIL